VDVEYKYSDTISVAVHTGTGGATVNVSATGSPTNIIGHGDGGVYVGSAGSVQQIAALLTITNPPKLTFLHVDDSADPTSRVATLSTFSLGFATYGQLSGLSPAAIDFRYSDVSGVSVDTGMATGNVVNVQGTGKPTSVIGHGYGAMVNLGDAGSVQGIQGPVTITNPPAHTTVVVDDSTDAGYRDVTLGHVQSSQ
jgi:hypothetical protein